MKELILTIIDLIGCLFNKHVYTIKYIPGKSTICKRTGYVISKNKPSPIKIRECMYCGRKESIKVPEKNV